MGSILFLLLGSAGEQEEVSLSWMAFDCLVASASPTTKYSSNYRNLVLQPLIEGPRSSVLPNDIFLLVDCLFTKNFLCMTSKCDRRRPGLWCWQYPGSKPGVSCLVNFFDLRIVSLLAIPTVPLNCTTSRPRFLRGSESARRVGNPMKALVNRRR